MSPHQDEERARSRAAASRAVIPHRDAPPLLHHARKAGPPRLPRLACAVIVGAAIATAVTAMATSATVVAGAAALTPVARLFLGS
jgi:hypothetical protein